MKFCVDYKFEGSNEHMSSQGMLEQLVNSIIEGPLYDLDNITFQPKKTKINELISHTADLRFDSNLAGVVYLVPFTCIPDLEKIHIVLLPFAFENRLSPVKYYYINKLISHTPDLRFNSNFAGVVCLVPFSCIPN